MKYYNIPINSNADLEVIKKMMLEVSQSAQHKEQKQQIIMNMIREWHETRVITTTTTQQQKIIDNSSNVSERQAAFNRKL
jgi:hypothetical protein